jgi:hypothetical protein
MMKSTAMLRRLLRSPILHFLLLGTALLTLKVWTDRLSPTELLVSGDRVAQLFAEFERHGGRAPEGEERALVLAKAEEEELFFQAALDLGMVDKDPDVRERLQALGRFAGAADGRTTEEAPAAALTAALDMDLHRRDAQVRSWLVEDARRFLLTSTDEPDDATLQAFLEADPERFRQDPGIRFSQVFLDRRHRGRKVEEDALLVLKRLQGEPFSRQLVDASSDPSKLALHTGDLSPEMVAKRFGAEFAQALFQLEPGRWQGPLESELGLHLVWIHEIHRGELPPLAEVRGAVRQVWLAERLEKREREILAGLRRHYRVRFETPAPATQKPAAPETSPPETLTLEPVDLEAPVLETSTPETQP